MYVLIVFFHLRLKDGAKESSNINADLGDRQDLRPVRFSHHQYYSTSSLRTLLDQGSHLSVCCSPLMRLSVKMTVANLIVLCGVSGAVDAQAGAFMLLTGKYLPPFVDSPLFSYSPRDFWSRRWNLLFKQTAHTVVFGPLRSMGVSPMIGAFVVFLFSSLLHEYMVFISRPDKPELLGYMTAFFFLHVTATILEAVAARPLLAILPSVLRNRNIAVGLTWVWMIGTAPFFFVPALECIPFMSWRLW